MSNSISRTNVKGLFIYDICSEFDEISPELMRVKDATLIAFFVGGMMGGIGRSRIAYMDFFRQNVATTYETPLQAKVRARSRLVLPTDLFYNNCLT
jgi:hypothetical protein